MIPCLESAGGNCQDAITLVDEVAITLKFKGALEGAKINSQNSFVMNDQQCIGIIRFGLEMNSFKKLIFQLKRH